MFIACIIWLVGSTLMCAVQDVAMLIVARVVNGFAVGMLTSQGYASPLHSKSQILALTICLKTDLHCRNQSPKCTRSADFVPTVDDYLGHSHHVLP